MPASLCELSHCDKWMEFCIFKAMPFFWFRDLLKSPLFILFIYLYIQPDCRTSATQSLLFLEQRAGWPRALLYLGGQAHPTVLPVASDQQQGSELCLEWSFIIWQLVSPRQHDQSGFIRKAHVTLQQRWLWHHPAHCSDRGCHLFQPEAKHHLQKPKSRPSRAFSF